ncbi:MAG: carboxymuconolactone decarboxylase family protein [Bdellovibrionales bacterium]
MSEVLLAKIESIFEGRESTIARDLKLNLQRLLQESQLPKEEALLVTLATAQSVGATALRDAARAELETSQISTEQIQEAVESAAIMAMLNTYYRFKHMVGKEEDYRQAGLRMTALARPQLGKERFEMLALAVSVLNGCEMCIKSHEKVLRDAGLSADKIHDIARLSAVVKGISAL